MAENKIRKQFIELANNEIEYLLPLMLENELFAYDDCMLSTERLQNRLDKMFDEIETSNQKKWIAYNRLYRIACQMHSFCSSNSLLSEEEHECLNGIISKAYDNIAAEMVK